MRLRPTPWLPLTLSLLGCASSGARHAPIEVETTPSRSEAPSATPAPPEDDAPLPLENRAERALCAGRGGCALLKLRKAGTRGDETLHVAFVEHEKEVKGRPPRPARRTAPLESDGHDEVLDVELDGCTNIEVWLLSEGKRGVAREHLLGEACNDGYGASGVGQDVFSFDQKGTLTHSRYGGSAWRWGATTTITLDPPTVVKSASDGNWNIAQNNETSSFDYRSFSGKTEWDIEPCDASGGPPTQQGGPVVHFAFAAIPDLSPKAIAGAELDKTPLGGCAALIDGDEAGYVLSGSDAKSSSVMRVLAAGGELHVEIDDDKFIDKGARRDEVEVWFAVNPTDYTEHCLAKQKAPNGFAIPAGGGPVRKLAGSLAAPDVVRTVPAGGKTRRLKIEILSAMEGVTVVYRDTDDGKTIGRAIATSDLDVNNEASVGRLRKLDPARVTCKAKEGMLTVVLPPIPHDAPAFGI